MIMFCSFSIILFIS